VRLPPRRRVHPYFSGLFSTALLIVLGNASCARGHPMRRILGRRSPVSPTREPSAFALFAAVQIADACSTAAGVAHFGAMVEANPILHFFMATFGVTAALLIWKIVALAGGVVLHVNARHLALVVLTVGYVYAAILPWAWLLAR
jgi:hypothetical protein